MRLPKTHMGDEGLIFLEEGHNLLRIGVGETVSLTELETKKLLQGDGHINFLHLPTAPPQEHLVPPVVNRDHLEATT
ncbi:MAG: hypothetical protein DDT21_02469 [Syntrophomonadaceae bacterium]|nr:hypothetical protein [Bacillota bacterium]